MNNIEFLVSPVGVTLIFSCLIIMFFIAKMGGESLLTLYLVERNMKKSKVKAKHKVADLWEEVRDFGFFTRGRKKLFRVKGSHIGREEVVLSKLIVDYTKPYAIIDINAIESVSFKEYVGMSEEEKKLIDVDNWKDYEVVKGRSLRVDTVKDFLDMKDFYINGVVLKEYVEAEGRRKDSYMLYLGVLVGVALFVILRTILSNFGIIL